jgi:hypothetical protein
MPKSICEKLLIRPGATVWASDPAYRTLLEPLPEDAGYAETPEDAAVALYFAADAASLRTRLDAHREGLRQAGVVWIVYPKGNRTT